MSVHFVLSETGRIYCDHYEVAVRPSSSGAIESLDQKILSDDERLYYRVPDELADLLMKSRVDAVSKAKVKSNFDAIYGAAKTSDKGDGIQAAYSWRLGKDGTLSFGNVVGEGAAGDDAAKAEDIKDMTKEEIIEWMSLSVDDPRPWLWPDEVWAAFVEITNADIKYLVEKTFLEKESHDHFKRLQESLAWLAENFSKGDVKRSCGEPAAHGEVDSAAETSPESPRPDTEGRNVELSDYVFSDFLVNLDPQTLPFSVGCGPVASWANNHAPIEPKSLKRLHSEQELWVLSEFVKNNPDATVEAYIAYAEKIKAAFDALEG